MGTTPEKVVTMYLDEKFKSATVEGELLAKCENLKTLSCASCGLTTLAGFPALANLKDLSLNDNRIADGLEALVGCKALSSLSLANNKLANVDDLKAVAEELTLSVLELEANPLTENEDYHEKVMTMMPTLNVLDGRDEFGNEIEDDDEDDDEDDGGARAGGVWRVLRGSGERGGGSDRERVGGVRALSRSGARRRCVGDGKVDGEGEHERGGGAKVGRRGFRVRNRRRAGVVHRIPSRDRIRQGLGVLQPRAHLLGEDVVVHGDGLELAVPDDSNYQARGGQGEGRRRTDVGKTRDANH